MPIYFTGGSFNGGTITNPLVITQGTITADAPQIDGTVTWNNAGIVGPVWKLNVTATSASVTAKLLEIQLSSTSKAGFTRDGASDVSVYSSKGIFSSPTLLYNNATASGLAFETTGRFAFYLAEAGARVNWTQQGQTLSSDSYFGFASTVSVSSGAVPDTKFYRDAANTFAWRNGTAAQRGDIDNTWTSATVKEGFKVDWITTANVCEVGVFKGSGGGTARQADWMSPDGIVALRFQMGFSTGRAPNIGTANVNTTAVGNTDTGEDVLMTYDLPLASFIAATKRVHITAWGNTANNANSKTLKMYFGSVILTNALTISIAGIWRIEADVVSTGTDAQDYVAQLVTTGTAGVALNDIEQGTLTEDDGAAITIKCTGEGVATNDIIQQGMIVVFGN